MAVTRHSSPVTRRPPMTCVRGWILLLLLAAAGPRLWAATTPENHAFEGASAAFNHHVWDRAEMEFADFRRTYTNSTRLPEAILYQAEARLQKGNYAGAISLLTPNVDLAGNLADEYLFSIGEAQFQQGALRPAADTFARLVKTFPASSRRLEALVRQATVLTRLDTPADWQHAAELLQTSNGLFQATARTNTANEFVRRGYLLLGEALLAQTNYPGAEAAVLPLESDSLPPPLAWQYRYLLSRIRIADHRPDAALQSATNLLALADATGDPALKAQSAALLGGIYETLGRADDAIAAYELNLPEHTLLDLQRQALLNMTRLYLAQNRTAEAAARLQQFLEQNPAAKSADFALVTLGELRLRLWTQAQGPATGTNVLAGTNYLQLAASALESFTNKFPQSPLFGKAQLALGWCFWLSNSITHDDALLAASETAFQSAVQRLPAPADSGSAYDLAVAHFKLADTQLRRTNYAAAITNYHAVAEQLSQWSVVQTNLAEGALYQIVRAGLDAGDLPSASNALARIMARYPNGFYTDRAVLLTGQTIGRQNPAAARDLFVEFSRQATNAPLRAEIQLAIARTYEDEQKWDQAIGQYDHWVNDAPTNDLALPKVLYFRAMANWRGGYKTNSLTQLTNFIDHFPGDPFAPLARWWVADYYRGIGRLEAAEVNYELIFQNTNWIGKPIAYRAQMEAGRVATQRTSWKDAIGYFGALASNTNCDAALRAQAYFALGSTYMASQEATNKTDYQQALNAFDQAALWGANLPISIQALGEKANCFLQLRDYASASNCYQVVLTTNRAGIEDRSNASVGLGVVLEKLAAAASGEAQSNLLFEACNRYLDVFYAQKFLRDGETASPYWTMKAGLEAARLLSAPPFKQYEAAILIYRDLQKQFPFLRLGEKIDALLKIPQTEARPKPS